MADYVEPLSNSFRRVIPAAIPAMLDCILASTDCSPSSLFSSLLHAFPKDITQGSEALDSEQRNFVLSYVGALCHLLKKSGHTHHKNLQASNVTALQHFIWRVIVPLMRLLHGHDLEIINKAVGSFLDVVAETNSWEVVEELVPYFLRLVGLSMGMHQSEQLAVFTWGLQLAEGHNNQLSPVDVSEDSSRAEYESLPLTMSCHVLTSILDTFLQREHVERGTSQPILPNGFSVHMFTGNLLWDMCNMTYHMLLQSPEHRSCAITIFLPHILKAFISDNAFHILVGSQNFILSRNYLFTKIWECCKSLFPLGPLEKRDAYTVLSLYLSFSSPSGGCEDVTALKDETFELRAEKEFWEEMKKGLVDKEGIVRKLSLHILKTTTKICGENQHSGATETTANGGISGTNVMTKRGRWADKEAKSLGVGEICNSADFYLNNQQKWRAFFLLYEMLEEYGTHLVEAAWNNQITLLCRDSLGDNFAKPTSRRLQSDQMDTLEEIFDWLAILWQRGLCHENPQVRCLIMQSFLGIEWKNYRNCTELVPEDFVLGPFLQGLNDPVHHKEFGVKGVYSSRTIEGAMEFIRQYTLCCDTRKQIAFLNNLAYLAKMKSFGRVGLMSLAECIASAANGVQTSKNHEIERHDVDFHEIISMESAAESIFYSEKAELIDIFRFIIENSKQHFNPNYRLKVCGAMLNAAVSVISVFNMPFKLLIFFIWSLPPEFINYGGSLRAKVQKWLRSSDEKHSSTGCVTALQLWKSLDDFPKSFIYHGHSEKEIVSCDDEDLEMWESEARRWARVLFLIVKNDHQLDPLLKFIQDHGINLCKQNGCLGWLPVKYLILVSSVVQELRDMQEKTVDHHIKRTNSVLLETVGDLSFIDASNILEKFTKSFALLLEELVSFTNWSCSVFWINVVAGDTNLPSSIMGKLGGPSQRRLSSSSTSAILKAITSVKALTSVSKWCGQYNSEVSLDSVLNSLWQLVWKIVLYPTSNSGIEAEIYLGAYEALGYLLKALVSMSSPLALDLLMTKCHQSQKAEGKPILDYFLQTFLENINSLIAVGNLARSRRAILINWKWICLESLLAIPRNALQKGVLTEISDFFFSDAMVRLIFTDLIESLENAGEDSVLPMLRSVRLVLELFEFGRMGSIVSSCNGMDTQMMWQLVHSSWVLHISCNKRRVAPIAALLSSVLHYSVFGDEDMHEIDNGPGPLKWFVEKILEEGTRSPRTIRLAALHLTGLWLSNPTTIKYYMKELKLLTLYGSVAFDEDFEAEVADNHDARSEVSKLARISDAELTEVFINTELYARVSVAVMFYNLACTADIVGLKDANKMIRASLQSGKLFLLELLDSVENDKDLAKELYKKYSATHRRKVRAWQMICILSRFVDQDIVHKVTRSLHVSLYRNNMPGVRQYLETFAIHVYLKFPSLVEEQLVPMIRDYNMRTQALSSYVFIAANVILHASKEVQSGHLDALLPSIIPLLTSHHHSLRGFSQLLVYSVLSKLLPAADSGASWNMSLEKRCFVELKSYLEYNTDCARLRASMEGHLDAFDPKTSASPTGLFSNRVEDVEFECAQTALLERVIDFLNDIREGLRCSMAKDAATLKNEQMQVDVYSKCNGISLNYTEEEMTQQLHKSISLDFQKKVTFLKHETRDSNSGFLSNEERYKSLVDFESEDELLDQSLRARSIAMEKLKAGRQHIILVASLLDRIPNLAGLARTCEVFKAASLAIADTNMIHDKQFQLISVTAEKWVPIIEVPVNNIKVFLDKKKQEGFSILGLEQTANSIALDRYVFPKKTVLLLGREKEGIPVELIHMLDACIEIPQLGVVRSLNVHVSGAIALWEYTRQQRSQ